MLSEGGVASEELVCEVVITLGSFAHGKLPPPPPPPPPCGRWIVCSCWCVVIGTADDVCAVVRSRALPVLVRGEEGEGLPVRLEEREGGWGGGGRRRWEGGGVGGGGDWEEVGGGRGGA